MKMSQYSWNAEGQRILLNLSDPSIQKAEEAFRDNDAQPLLEILEVAVGEPLSASLSKLLSDILTGKVKRRKGVSRKVTLTHNDIVQIGCLVRDLRDSGVKRKYALQDVAEMFSTDPEFEARVAELDGLRDSAGLPKIGLTRVKLAYKAFQAMERDREQSPSKTSSYTQ